MFNTATLLLPFWVWIESYKPQLACRCSNCLFYYFVVPGELCRQQTIMSKRQFISSLQLSISPSSKKNEVTKHRVKTNRTGWGAFPILFKEKKTGILKQSKLVKLNLLNLKQFVLHCGMTWESKMAAPIKRTSDISVYKYSVLLPVQDNEVWLLPDIPKKKTYPPATNLLIGRTRMILLFFAFP